MATRRGALPEQPSLVQFVVLSMALHALFIVLFGAPSGGSPGGRAMWGSLDVVLKGPFPDAGTNLLRDRGEPQELPVIAAKPRPAGGRDSAAEPAPIPAAPAPPVDLSATKESDREVPFTPPSLLERVIPPELNTEMLPPVNLPPVEVAPVIPAPIAPLVAPPRIDRPMAPRVELPPPEVAPVIPSTMPALAAPPRIDRPMAPRVELPPLEVAPVIPPAMPALAAPPRIDRPMAPRVELPPLERTPGEAPAAPPPQPAIERAPTREVPARTAPSFRAPGKAPADRAGDASADSVAPSATPEKGAGPRIDLDAARARAREMGREGTGNRALLPFPMPAAPERKSKEAIAIENALKPECKNAYQGLGLLAVVPLIANEFGEGNCRW